MELIAIAFMEELKAATCRSTIFQSKLLSQIATQGPAAAPLAGFSNFAAHFDKITVPLERIDQPLEGVHEKLDKQTRLLDQLTNQRSEDIARERRLFQGREELYLAELDRRAKDLSNTTQERDSLAAERTQLLETIAQRDRSASAEIAEYRKQIAALTQSPPTGCFHPKRCAAPRTRLPSKPLLSKRLNFQDFPAAEVTTADGD